MSSQSTNLNDNDESRDISTSESEPDASFPPPRNNNSETTSDLVHIEEDNSDIPIPVGMMEVFNAMEEKEKNNKNHTPSTWSTAVNTTDEGDDDDVQQTTISPPTLDVVDIEQGGNYESTTTTISSEVQHTVAEGGGINDNTQLDDGEGRETNILEAYVVDNDIYDATILEVSPPWWKQRRAKIFFVVVFIIVGSLAISLGVALSNQFGKQDMIVMASSSLSPSSSPTFCVDEVSNSMYNLGLQKDLQINNPLNAVVAADGRSMVVAVQDGDESGPVYISFYSLMNDNNKWQRAQSPIRIYDFGRIWKGPIMRTVAISGTTTFIGAPYSNNESGSVFVYEQNVYGVWEKVDDPFIHDSNVTNIGFGWTVHVAGDLACVDDMHTTTSSAHLFRRKDYKWVQFETLRGSCYMAEDTMVIVTFELDDPTTPMVALHPYKFNRFTNEFIPTQEQAPIVPVGEIWAGDMSSDYIMFMDYIVGNAFIYHQDEKNQSFAFTQQLNMSAPESNGLVLNDGVLVLGGNNHTHIYTLQDDNWEETITLDESYDSYQVTDRTLIAIKGSEVYSYDTTPCIQTTQIPSPTMSPSSIEQDSLQPTSSLKPTETRYCIEITIVYDRNPWQTSWDLFFNNALVKSHAANFGDTSFSQTICLQEGTYTFIINDWDGLCCNSVEGGHYNVTTSSGMMIVEGGEFDIEESTSFSIPFEPT